MTGRTKRPVPVCASPGLGLAFADGKRWAIRAMDASSEAAVVELGRVMRLGPAHGGGELCAVANWEGARRPRKAGRRGLTCWLGPARDRRAEVLAVERIATALAVRSLTRGGLLLHGGLAVRDGAGFVLAGPSGVGKSLACRRLPAPWQALSDDCVLVVRDAGGRYWAHPWPTWSLLRDNGPAESWPVGQAVPLKALLFLVQSTMDRATPVGITPATALIAESAFQLRRTVMFSPDGAANRATCRKYLRAAWALAAAVPALRLHVSLNGQFWKEIERVTPIEPQADADGHRRGPGTEQDSETTEQGAGFREEGDVLRPVRRVAARQASGKAGPRFSRGGTRK